MKRSVRTSAALVIVIVSTLVAALPAAAAPPRIVFTRTQLFWDGVGAPPDPATHGVFAVNVDGSGLARLSAGEHMVYGVSPDDTRVLHGRGKQVWEMATDGSTARKLADDGRHASYSPDGGWVAWHTSGNIVVARADGTQPRILTAGALPTWSADGRRIVFADDVGPNRDREGLFVVDLDGTGRRLLVDNEVETQTSDITVSPSTGEIAYTQTDFGGGATRVFIVEPDGTDRRELPNTGIDPNLSTDIDFADDGSRIAFSAHDPSTNGVALFSIRTDGTDKRRIFAAGSGPRDSVAPVYVGNAPGALPAEAAFDGDPVTTERLDAASPTAAAVVASRRLWSDRTGVVTEEATEPALPRATYAVLSRIDTFADSLTGAALTFRGPLLYTTTAELPPETRGELSRILGPRGLVYVLGGEKAISPAVVATLEADGYTVRRLAGATRVETAIAVADEVRRQFPNRQRVVLARADGPGTAAWADSVTGGAFAADARIPLLLTPTDQLHPAVKAWMDRTGPSQTLLLGGAAALSSRVEQSVPSPVRVAGAARDETATAVVKALWKVEPTGTRRYTVINGYANDGWAWGLAAAGLADRAEAPLLMVAPETVPSATSAAVPGCRQVDLLVVGNTNTVSQARIDELNARDTRC